MFKTKLTRLIINVYRYHKIIALHNMSACSVYIQQEVFCIVAYITNENMSNLHNIAACIQIRSDFKEINTRIGDNNKKQLKYTTSAAKGWTLQSASLKALATADINWQNKA